MLVGAQGLPIENPPHEQNTPIEDRSFEALSFEAVSFESPIFEALGSGRGARRHQM